MKIDGRRVKVVVSHGHGSVSFVVDDATWRTWKYVDLSMSPSQAFALSASLRSHGTRAQVAQARARAKKEKKR